MERRADEEIDAAFWAIVGRRTADAPEIPDDGAPDQRSSKAVVDPGPGVGTLWAVAALAGVVAVVATVVLIRFHLAAGVVWLYVGAPTSVLAALVGAQRLRCRRPAAPPPTTARGLPGPSVG